jgi:hypothetical protein
LPPKRISRKCSLLFSHLSPSFPLLVTQILSLLFPLPFRLSSYLFILSLSFHLFPPLSFPPTLFSFPYDFSSCPSPSFLLHSFSSSSLSSSSPLTSFPRTSPQYSFPPPPPSSSSLLTPSPRESPRSSPRSSFSPSTSSPPTVLSFPSLSLLNKCVKETCTYIFSYSLTLQTVQFSLTPSRPTFQSPNI